MNTHTNARLLTCCLSFALAAAAQAGPRDTATSPSESAGTYPSGFDMTVTGNYPMKFVRIQGTHAVQTISGGARDSLVYLSSADASMPPMAFSVFASDGFVLPSQTIDAFVRVPHAVPNAHGDWYIRFPQLYSSTGNVDAIWTNVRITFNDGPPSFQNMGVLSNGSATNTSPLAPNQTLCYKFDVQGNISSGGLTFLDIDTEGSGIGAPGLGVGNDTVMALYDENGMLVAWDDDDGSGSLSQLSFGRGTRAAVGSSAAYDGRDGSLAAGTYYLIVRAYSNGAAPAVGWDWPISGSSRAGTIKVNFRTNSGFAPGCPADFNHSGTLEAQDIFDFLSAWFGGCP